MRVMHKTLLMYTDLKDYYSILSNVENLTSYFLYVTLFLLYRMFDDR